MDHRGTLWVETKSGGLLYLPSHETILRRANYDARTTVTFVFMHEAPDGSIWLADETGLRRVTEKGGKPGVAPFNAKTISSGTEFGNFTFSSDGTLWAGTPHGLSRFVDLDGWPSYKPLDENKAESFTTKQGLSSDGIWKVLVDRESNIWVGSNGGLDQLRRTPLTVLTLPHAQESQIGVASGNSGSLWIGSRTMPLTHVTADGKFTEFPHIRLLTLVRRDRRGTIWAGSRGEARLWRLVGDHFDAMHYPGEYDAGVSSLALDRNDDLWLLLLGGATYRLRQGVWSDETETLRRKPGVLGAMTGDESGNVWIAFSTNLVRWNGTTYDRFSFPEGELNISVRTLSVRDDRVWMGGKGGVVLFHQGQFHLMRWKSPDFPGRVTGIVETKSGDLWMNGYSGATHLSAEELSRWLGDFSYEVSGDHLDALDGLPGLAGDRTPEPSLVESQDGRLLFATTKSVAWLDPTTPHRLLNRIVPPVEIVSVAANGKVYRNMKGLRLPARTENLEIDFTAVSLAMPERVFFRYKLDGVDRSWQDSGTRRQAFYTKLPPRQYQFHVTACNNDGLWNEAGASLSFVIAPTYYQTTWFRALCVLAFLALAYGAYRFRVRQLRRQEKKLRDVVETIPAIAWSARADGWVDFSNHHWEEYTGLSIEKGSGSGWEAAVHPNDVKRHAEKWRASVASGEPFESEARYRRADGEYRWFLVRAVPLRDGEARSSSGTGPRPTSKIASGRNRSQSDLAHMNRVSIMGELSASLSHELKQPIAATITSANTALRWLDRDQPDVERARASYNENH